MPSAGPGFKSRGRRITVWVDFWCRGKKNLSSVLGISVNLTLIVLIFYSHKADRHMPDLPTTVYLIYTHNHAIRCADALKHRDVSAATKDKLRMLFGKKYGPSSALQALKYDLQEEHGDKYFMIAGDRSQCPDLGYCNR